MTVCVGIDYDTNCVHLVRMPTDGMPPTYHPRSLRGHDAFERMRQVSWNMPDEGWWEDVLAVGIEEPGGKYVVAKLKGIQGAIVASLPLNLLVAPYHAGKWRNLCGLPGNCPKDTIKEWVQERLGENPQWPQDGYDAYALAYAVSTQVRSG